MATIRDHQITERIGNLSHFAPVLCNGARKKRVRRRGTGMPAANEIEGNSRWETAWNEVGIGGRQATDSASSQLEE